MQYQHDLRTRVWSLVMGFTICSALTVLSPVPAQAIPSAGDYTFTSGFTGTFTSNGTSVTEYNFIDAVGMLWLRRIPVILEMQNNVTYFALLNDFNGATLIWNWADGVFADCQGTACRIGTMSYTGDLRTVPEHSSAVFIGLGLLLLHGYGWRQRRATGLQIG